VAWPGRELPGQPARPGLRFPPPLARPPPPPEVKMEELGKKVKMLEKIPKKMLEKNVGTIFHGFTHDFNIS
jgi:hypothetical protein